MTTIVGLLIGLAAMPAQTQPTHDHLTRDGWVLDLQGEGACCLPREVMDCVDVDQDTCQYAYGGIFMGEALSCSDAGYPCVAPCCDGEGGCSMAWVWDWWRGRTDCSGWLHWGYQCDPGGYCGACCGLDGCRDSSRDACLNDYQGSGTDCSPDPCTYTGACCVSDGRCREGDEGACRLLGGAYQGHGTRCGPARNPGDAHKGWGTCGACISDALCCCQTTEALCGEQWVGWGSMCGVR